MIIKKENLNFLGINTKENKIINRLEEKSPAKVTDIAKNINTPRTTVYFLLNKLEDREIVEKIKIANHYEWQLISNLDFSQKLEKILKLSGKSKDVEIHSGQDKIIEAYEQILNFNKTNRIYTIQGNKSAKHAIERINKQKLYDIHQKTKKDKIIIEGIIGQSSLKLFKQMSSSDLQSHFGRPVIAYVVPDKYVDFDVDIIIHKNTVMLINFKNETVIINKEGFLTDLIKSLYSLMIDQSDKIDLNKYIKESINK